MVHLPGREVDITGTGNRIIGKEGKGGISFMDPPFFCVIYV